MPQGMSQWARAVVVGASQRVSRDMGLLRSTRWALPSSHGGCQEVSEPPSALSNGLRSYGPPVSWEEIDAQGDLFDEHVARRLHRRPRWALRLDAARPRGLSLLDRRDPRGRCPPHGATAVRDDAVLGDRGPGSGTGRRRARVDRALEAITEGRLLHHAA